jgi:ParB/RepB/Spo0J family partition protein
MEEKAMTDGTGRKIVKLEIARLHAHPRQAELFCPAAPHEIAELAADMKRNGLRQPVEPLPDGTLLAGHRRLDAAQSLGWTHIEAWVRDELADDPVAAEKRLIEDNLIRRQLAPLELARCYQRLKALATQKSGYRLPGQDTSELRDQIGQRLGVSGRNLDRHLRVLTHTPFEVQDAVAAGKLGMTVAEKVASLDDQQRAQIASLIRNGGDARSVVRQFLQTVPSPTRSAYQAFHFLIQSLRRAVRDLQEPVGKASWVSTEDKKILADGERLIRRLRDQVVNRPARDSTTDEPPADDAGDDGSAVGGRKPTKRVRPDTLSGGRRRRRGRRGGQP